MKYVLRIVLFFVCLFLLSYIGLFVFSSWYYWFPQNGASSWLGGKDQWARLFGLMLSFYFVLPLLIVLFFYKIKYYLLPIVIILLMLAVWLFYPDLAINSVLIGLSIAGWLIGGGILRLYKMAKK